jgi:hypothetical protein
MKPTTRTARFLGGALMEGPASGWREPSKFLVNGMLRQLEANCELLDG